MPHAWTAGAPRKEPEQRARGSASGASRITQDALMFYHKSCTRTGKGPVKIPENCPWLQAGVCVTWGCSGAEHDKAQILSGEEVLRWMRSPGATGRKSVLVSENPGGQSCWAGPRSWL